MQIEVKIADRDDIDSINEILGELHECESELRARKLKQALESNCSAYFLAVTPRRVVGYLNIWHLPDIIDGGEAGIIMDIYVSGKFRDRGVGKLLLDSAIEFGDKLGINKYYGWMGPENMAAIALMKRYGFSAQGLMFEKKSN